MKCQEWLLQRQNLNQEWLLQRQLPYRSNNVELNGVLEITNEKLVSVDFNHNQASSIVDGSLTNVIGTNMGKISSWYDNEWGFSNRMCDIALYLHKNCH